MVGMQRPEGQAIESNARPQSAFVRIPAGALVQCLGHQIRCREEVSAACSVEEIDEVRLWPAQ